MKSNITSWSLVYVTFLVFILSGHLVCIIVSAKHHRKNGKAVAPAPEPPAGNEYDGNSKIFNVLNYGAAGNGQSDDTSAFEKAWADACKVQGSTTTMLVPDEHIFKLRPVSFPGKCQSNIVFQLDGTIISSTNPEDWESGDIKWLDFTTLKGLTIQGHGIVDGQGSNWWNEYTTTEDKLSGKPTALRVADSTNVKVTGITIQNSQQAHLKFDNCVGVDVSEITISSPGDSPNTDGIHLQNSQTVAVYNSKIGCGDDAISIQTGCSGINIHDVSCGPSHGISIGSLGKDGTIASVSDVTVRDSKISKSENGVRIKTWQGGSGSVKGVTFSNIQVTDVKTPIVIDQYYSQSQKNEEDKTSSNVAISGITFDSITGDYLDLPMSVVCSGSVPCKGLIFSDIELKSSGENAAAPECSNAYGVLKDGPTFKCLQSGNP
ncbi:hypothetical protein OROMI_032417 [Orobanche minor]